MGRSKVKIILFLILVIVMKKKIKVVFFIVQKNFINEKYFWLKEEIQKIFLWEIFEKKIVVSKFFLRQNWKEFSKWNWNKSFICPNVFKLNFFSKVKIWCYSNTFWLRENIFREARKFSSHGVREMPYFVADNSQLCKN